MQWRHRGARLYLGQAPKVYFRCQGMGPAGNETYEIIFLTAPTDAGAICIKKRRLTYSSPP